MVVNLVEVTSVDELVDKVKKGKYRSGSEILANKSRSCHVCIEFDELRKFRRDGSRIR
jgi:hypothetical protein